MSEYKHTPGPWVAVPSLPTDGFECYWLRASLPYPAPFRGFKILDIGSINGPQSGEAEANARLAAAAPELLEALEMTHAALHVIAAYLKDKREIDPLLVIGSAQCAETVIKKAIGATP